MFATEQILYWQKRRVRTKNEDFMAELRDASITVSISRTDGFTLLPKRSEKDQDNLFQGNFYSTKAFNPVVRSYHHRRFAEAFLNLLRETTAERIIQLNIPPGTFMENLIKNFRLDTEAAYIVNQLLFDISLINERDKGQELLYKVGLKFLCDLLIYLELDPLLAFTKLDKL